MELRAGARRDPRTKAHSMCVQRECVQRAAGARGAHRASTKHIRRLTVLQMAIRMGVIVKAEGQEAACGACRGLANAAASRAATTPLAGLARPASQMTEQVSELQPASAISENAGDGRVTNAWSPSHEEKVMAESPAVP
eukprot:5749914-Prymnesium_polylepis.1